MRKKIALVSIMVAIVIAFGYLALFSTSKDNIFGVLNQENNSLESEVDGGDSQFPLQGIASMDELRMSKENLECTIIYSAAEVGTEIEGTYFTSDGQMRGDFLTESPDLIGKILSSMIVANDTMYVWSEIEGNSYGYKVNLLEEKETSNIKTKEPVELGAEVTYDCKPWSAVNNGVFVPPGEVLFRDFNQLIETGMEYGNVYNEEAELSY